MELKKIIEVFGYKIADGSEFTWQCYGSNARYLDFESEYAHGSVIFDAKTQVVYEAEISAKEDGDDNLPGPYRYFNPEFKSAYILECGERGVNPISAWDDVKWIDLEVAEDFFEKANAIFNNLPFDRRIQIPLDLTDDLMLHLAMEAHKRDITLNQMVELILKEAIQSIETNKELFGDES
jgi:hypothetical protein